MSRTTIHLAGSWEKEGPQRDRETGSSVGSLGWPDLTAVRRQDDTRGILMCQRGCTFPLLPYRGGKMSLEKGPSATLPAQGVDTFPTSTPHLLKLAWIGGLPGRRKGSVCPPPTHTSIPCFGAPKRGHGKCASLYEWDGQGPDSTGSQWLGWEWRGLKEREEFCYRHVGIMRCSLQGT